MADVELYEIKEDVSKNTLKQGLYTIYDSVSKTFLPPFLAQNIDEAVRNFTNLLNYSQSSLTRFPHDFDLYYICEFITCITGDEITIKKTENDVLGNMSFITNGSALIQDDTLKFDSLKDGLKRQSDELSNVAKSLQNQIGSVPNIAQQMNTINSKIIELSDKLEHLEKSDVSCVPSKKSIIKSLFS